MVTTNSQRWKAKNKPRAGEERRAVVAGKIAGKVSKDGANYRQAMDEAKTGESCAECKNFLKKGSIHSDCSKVAGIIEANDYCDLFEARGRKATATN